MKYPYIGKGKSSGSIVLLYGEGFGLTLDSKTWATEAGKFESFIDESYFKNITREYLEGKCVKVESPEHMNFIAILGVNSGFELLPPSGNDYIEFCSSGKFKACREHGRVNEWITIPLPPESKPKDDWPKVGDEFIHDGELVTCISKGETSKGEEVVTFEHSDKLSHGSCWNIPEWVKKPKTEAEILRDELTQDINEMINNDSSTNAFVDLIIDKYIAKNPQ